MTYPAPKYLKDDPWFGPAIFTDKQMEYKLAYEQAVIENLLLDEPICSEVKNIHQVMYDIATGHGKTTLHLGGSENFHE